MKSLFKSRLAIFVSLYLFLLLAWEITLFVNPEKTLLSNYLFNVGYGLIYFIGGIVGIVYAKRIGLISAIGKSFTFIGAGLLSYGVAQFVWFFYNTFSSIEVPYPSIADGFFLLFYALIFIGFLLLLNIFKQSLTRPKIVESIILLPIVFIFSLVFIFKPDLSSDLPLLVKTMNIIYPVCDTLLLYIILVMLRVSGGYFKSTTIFFAVAGVMQLIADFIFTYRTSNGTYWNGDISDLVFMISSYLFLLSFVFFMQKMTEIKS